MHSLGKRPRLFPLFALFTSLVITPLLSCGDSNGAPTGPTPGEISVTVAGKADAGPLGAVIIRVDGRVEAVREDGTRIFRRDRSGASWLIVVAREPGELRFRLGVPDLTTPPALVVVEATDSENRPVTADAVSLEVRP